LIILGFMIHPSTTLVDCNETIWFGWAYLVAFCICEYHCSLLDLILKFDLHLYAQPRLFTMIMGIQKFIFLYKWENTDWKFMLRFSFNPSSPWGETRQWRRSQLKQLKPSCYRFNVLVTHRIMAFSCICILQTGLLTSSNVQVS
jgi:hypothetical protein